MVKYMSFATISRVTESWEQTRHRINCDEELGRQILVQLLLNEPHIKPMFGFSIDQEIDKIPSDDSRLTVHGLMFVKMFDISFSLLGPDTETLEMILGQMGERHKQFGVTSQHFSCLRKAVCGTLSEILGKENWRNETNDAWVEVLNELSSIIIRSMKNCS
jgi:hemoglobin-like flavoprotein